MDEAIPLDTSIRSGASNITLEKYNWLTLTTLYTLPPGQVPKNLGRWNRKLTYADYVIHASSWSSTKKSRSLKRKEKELNTASTEYLTSPPGSSIFSTFFDTGMESLKAGRKPEKPFSEKFIGSSMKVVTLIKVIHDHGNSCRGTTIIPRNTVLLKRLTLQVSVKCSLGNRCQVWENGLFKWFSSGQIPEPNTSRRAFVPDVLYALATYLTPTT